MFLAFSKNPPLKPTPNRSTDKLQLTFLHKGYMDKIVAMKPPFLLTDTQYYDIHWDTLEDKKVIVTLH